jgi:hypothetical protein
MLEWVSSHDEEEGAGTKAATDEDRLNVLGKG